MAEVQKPSKEAVRSFLQERQARHLPPPSPEEVRRALGWTLTPQYDPLNAHPR